MIRVICFFLFTTLSYYCFPQNRIEVLDTNGNVFVGKLVLENDQKICIQSKENKLCFDSAEIESYGKYNAYSRAYPLTRELNPILLSHDIGLLYRSNVGGTGLYYSFGALKRVNNHLSYGLEGSLGIGDFLELNLRAIGSYQLNPNEPKVHTFSLASGPLKEFFYWSEKGFDVNFGYTLLLRKERNKSRRISFSTGLYSANYVWCSGEECVPYDHRSNELQIKLGYGWQF